MMFNNGGIPPKGDISIVGVPTKIAIERSSRLPTRVFKKLMDLYLF
jgi:hypothetical protein